MYLTYRAGKKRLSEFTPAQFSPPSNSQFKYDASDISTLYQDTAGTVPVTTNSDPVGRWVPVEAKGSNRVQPASGFGEYFSATTYGPAVQVRLFRDQISGGPGAPPTGASPRFMYAVTSSAGLLNTHLIAGYGVNGGPFVANPQNSIYFRANANEWTMEASGSPNVILQVARTTEQAVLLGWYDGADLYFRVNDNAPISTSSVLNTVEGFSTGWHISHEFTAGGFSAPSASELYKVHECGLYDYVPTQEEIDALFSAMNSKWNGIGNTT